jgi:hypothetical protein
MEVRHHEVGVGEFWKSIAGAASSTPGRPPSRKVTRKPIENSIGVSNVVI